MSSLIPEDISFNQNTVLFNSNNEDVVYQNGEYKASSSSILNIKNDAFCAFDNNSNTYWSSNNSSNKTAEIKYQRDGYNGFVPSSYIGGGTDETYWKTIANNKQYLGEWIQIKLPYSVYLAEYSILSNQFPRQFHLFGSNDGSTWELLDSQTSKDNYSNLSTPTSFKIKTILNFNHYRLVISQLFNGTTASITQLKLFGNRNKLVNLKSLENYINYSDYTNSYNTNLKSPYYSNNTNFMSMEYKPFSKFDVVNSNKITENFVNIREPYTISDINYKINEYNLKSNIAVSNHGNLVTGINNYFSTSNELLNSSLYDYSGNILFLNNGKQTTKDALESDTKDLAAQENNVFILGTISLAILIVGTIVVLRN
jgi:hypothetical protein